MTTLEPASVALKLAFLAVLYLFLLWVVRSAMKDLRRTRAAARRARRGRRCRAGRPTPTRPACTAPASRARARRHVDGEPRLVVDHAPGHPDGIAYSLERGATLGRGDVEIRLEDPFASTRHARIERQGSVLVLEDLGSTNGTYLNEEPLNGPQPLHHGDRIRIGDCRVHLPSGLTPMLRVAEHFEKSDTGRQRRANEDSFFVRAPLFVVADGMGGAQAGEVASRPRGRDVRARPARRRHARAAAGGARARGEPRASTSVSQERPRAARHGHDDHRRLPRRRRAGARARRRQPRATCCATAS